MTTAWRPEDLVGDLRDPGTLTPVLGQLRRMLPDIDIWDMWPVRTPTGAVADVCGGEVWVGLSAPATGHPGERHDQARLRMMRRQGDGWVDLGPLFPDGASAGSREWAGSTVLDPATGVLSAYYTAAGIRGEQHRTFRQRLMVAEAQLTCTADRPVLTWGEHRELVAADGARYVVVDQEGGEPGFIKAFRDPFFVRDGDTDYVLFTASVAGVDSDFNGCIGAAARGADGWQLLDPLVTAVGVNNELERPHTVWHDGRCYLFFSTQRRTFDPAVTGPTGLYGFVGDTLTGPFTALNGTGLVLQNPLEEPFQAYSWLVLDDLRVSGFVDSYDLHGVHPDDLEKDGADVVRRHFGGTITPFSRIVLADARAEVEPV